MRAVKDLATVWPQLVALSAESALNAPAVSQWSIGHHLDHLVKVHAGIFALCAEAPADPPCAPGITLIGRVVLLTGHIPRGRGKSPEQYLPQPMSTAELMNRIAALQVVLADIAMRTAWLRTARERFAHPVFGGLTRAQWLRFAVVHQNHHLAIIRDIRLAAGQHRA